MYIVLLTLALLINITFTHWTVVVYNVNFVHYCVQLFIELIEIYNVNFLFILFLIVRDHILSSMTERSWSKYDGDTRWPTLMSRQKLIFFITIDWMTENVWMTISPTVDTLKKKQFFLTLIFEKLLKQGEKCNRFITWKNWLLIISNNNMV